jgi:hypothetical protein
MSCSRASCPCRPPLRRRRSRPWPRWDAPTSWGAPFRHRSLQTVVVLASSASSCPCPSDAGGVLFVFLRLSVDETIPSLQCSIWRYLPIWHRTCLIHVLPSLVRGELG